MIFVTVGNWKGGFDRLIREVDELAARKTVDEPVKIQIGHGSYQPVHCEWFKYCSPQEYENCITRASMIISHSGMGTIGIALRYAKPTIVLPRKAVLNECFDDHQFNTARQLEAEGKVLVAYEVQELQEKIRQARTFVPTGSQTSQELIQFIDHYLKTLAQGRHEK